MLSKAMKLVEHGQGGPASVMKINTEAPIPSPKSGEVLIEVAYAGVNRPDVFQRSGAYPPPRDASPYLGLEVSGKIVSLGEGVTEWAVGDDVCALTPGGGYAEYCVVEANHCLPVPHGLNMAQAAAIPENYFTVWANIFDLVHLTAGETILIHGGSSGIGLTAIQLSKAFGAKVITTVGSELKADACRQAGADLVVNYREQAFEDVVKAQTNGKGVNVILDMVGGSYIERNIRSLALEGRLVQIAFLEGSRVNLDLMPIMLRRLTVTGSTLRARSSEQKQKIAHKLRQNIWPLLEKAQCLPVIYKTFDLEDVTKAHELMESSVHIGKILLKIKG